MTREEFQAKYRLLQQVSDVGATTYHAMATNGAVVMVHMLDKEAGDANHVIHEQLDGLDPTERQKILKVLEVDGSTVLVTKFILDFESLRAWLESHTRASHSPADTRKPTVEPAPPLERTTEEIARPFVAGLKTPGGGKDLSNEPEVSEEKASAPGDFTGLFRIAREDGDAAVRPSHPTVEKEADTVELQIPSRLPEPKTGTPGEFTGLFKAVPSDSIAQPPAQLKSDTEEAKSTIEPQHPGRGPSPPAEDSPAPLDFEWPELSEPPSKAPVPKPEGPGEFTRLFRAMSADFTAPAAPDPAAEPDPDSNPEETPAVPLSPPSAGLRQTDKAAPRGTPAIAPPDNRSSAAPPVNEPGEFTRIFGRVEMPGALPPPLPIAEPPAPWNSVQPPLQPSASNPDLREKEREVSYGESYLDRLQSSPPRQSPTPSPAGSSAGAPPPISGYPPSTASKHEEEVLLPPQGPPTPPPTGPSEYTRIIAAFPQAATPVTPPHPDPQGVPVEEGRGPSLIPILVGLGIVLLAVIALLLYFVLQAP